MNLLEAFSQSVAIGLLLIPLTQMISKHASFEHNIN